MLPEIVLMVMYKIQVVKDLRRSKNDSIDEYRTCELGTAQAKNNYASRHLSLRR